MLGRLSSDPPSTTVAADSIAYCRSRRLRGGGKYSSSSSDVDDVDAVLRRQPVDHRLDKLFRRRCARRYPHHPREVIGQFVGVVDAQHLLAAFLAGELLQRPSVG